MGYAMKAAKNRRMVYVLLTLLVLYMPLHYYISELWLRNTAWDNIIRDFVIILLFIFVVFTRGCKINRTGILILVNSGLLAAFAFVSSLLFGYPNTFNVLRTYVVPCLIFFVSSKIDFTRQEFLKLIKLFIIQLMIISLFGFFQAFFLGGGFLVKLGYPNTNGILSSSSYYIGGFYGYQRVVGTFISPNIFATILTIGICAVSFSNVNYGIKHKGIVLASLLLALLGTFSRSSMIGLLAAGIIYFGWKAISQILKIKLWIVILVFITLIYILDALFLNNLLLSMLFSSFISIINKTDPSAIKHWEDLFQPLSIIVEHPLGLGFGNNGPMALEQSTNVKLVESSLYLMMYDAGIIVGPLFLAPYIVVIIKTIRNRAFKYYAPACICTAVLTTYIFLPNVQAFEVLFYSYLFMGFYFNASIRRIFAEQPYAGRINRI